MVKLTEDEMKDALEKVPEQILWPYKDNIKFGKYPVRRGRLYEILMVYDGDTRIMIAVQDVGGFSYYARDGAEFFAEDFLSRRDWKQYWCLE